MGYRPSRWTLAAFAFAVVAGFIAWLILGRTERAMRLADGREFSIVAVTYGTNHVFKGGPPWARLMARSGLRSIAVRFGYSLSGNLPSSTPCLVVWTRWSLSNSNPPPRFASVAAARGVETEPIQVALAPVSVGKKDGMLMAWRFENYPRLQKEFTLRVYDYDFFRVRGRREGEVAVRNPVAIVKPPAPAPIAPVKATNGVLECTLRGLQCGGPPAKRPLTAKSAIAPWATAEFEFRENGQPTTDWTVKRIEAFGATSNYFFGDRLVVELEEGRRVARFTGAFWQDELDWKLVAEVVPIRNFPAESLWSLRVPTRAFLHETFVTNLQAEAKGMRNFQLTIWPKSGDAVRQGKPGLRVATLRINYTPDAPDLHADVASAIDDQGRELLIPSSIMPRTGSCEADLQLMASAEFVDLTFAILRSRKLEFRVRPVLVSTNAPSTFPAPGR